MTEATVDQVLEALAVAFTDASTTSAARKQATNWLEDFQKTPVAWQITDTIIRQGGLPPSCRMFAAQTFRQKIEYDLDQLDGPSRHALRDTLFQLLYNHRSDTRNLQTQLCLSLADLAIQMQDWEDPVTQILHLFAKNAEMGAVVVQFLRVLPEEMRFNRRMSLEREKHTVRTDVLVTRNVPIVVELLIGYLHTAANDDAKVDILDCLASWLRSAEISTTTIELTPLVEIASQGLGSEALFDASADVMIELISISSRKPSPPKLIEAVYHKLVGLKPLLRQHKDDPDMVRGYCRVLVEAGERYADLIVTNLPVFGPLLDDLLFCVSYHDVDIAKVTFGAWYTIAEVATCRDAKHILAPVYSQLLDAMIQHLKYPSDFSDWTASERDEFRDFRHEMGDVLKDCVRILGDEASLIKPVSILRSVFAQKLDAQQLEDVWPVIEAPLFALRVMCREISLTESQLIPEVMAMLPQLPKHRMIKYATILVIGRYAEWTNVHPETLSFQLEYVSKGFEETREVVTAASQTFRDLCQYCSAHLVNLLPQLHPFYIRTVASVDPSGKIKLTEAVAHVIHAAPVSQVGAAMQMFVQQVSEELFEVAGRGLDNASPAEIQDTILMIDELAKFYQIVNPSIPQGTPHPIVEIICSQWPVLETLTKSHALCESLSRMFCRALRSYRHHLDPLLAKLTDTMCTRFSETGLPCWLWVSGSIVKAFATVHPSVVCAFVERLTGMVFANVQATDANFMDIDEVMNEYHDMLAEFAESSPEVFLGSTLLDASFQCGMYCLSTASPIAPTSVLRFFCSLYGLGSESEDGTTPSPQCKQAITTLLSHRGVEFTMSLMKGLVSTFPRDREIVHEASETCMSIARVIGKDACIAMITTALDATFTHEEISGARRQVLIAKLATAFEDGKDRGVRDVFQEMAAQYVRRTIVKSRQA